MPKKEIFEDDKKTLLWFSNKWTLWPTKFRGYPHETWEAVLNTNYKLEQTNFLLVVILCLNAINTYYLAHKVLF